MSLRHLKKITNSINLRKQNLTLPRSFLLMTYKSCSRPNLDYGDIVYDQRNNLSETIESQQYNVVLVITGENTSYTSITSSKEKLYQNLGFVS